ncbi:MAG: radical SAM protein [Bacillota bacterium]
MANKFRDFVVPPADPCYLELDTGELRSRAQAAMDLMEACQVCARRCGIDRRDVKTGVCRTGMRAVVASYGPHRGEERPLSGTNGSGTIFFARCNLRCKFCQNFDLVCEDAGREVTAPELAAIMLRLQGLQCHNVNLVSPSHVVPQCLEALAAAVDKGLRLPVVYNTGGYDSLESLKLLESVVDIYMPDMKYGDNEAAQRYSGVSDYLEVNQAAVKEMHRQVGDLVVDREGIAVRGLLVRHLVLPGDVSGTRQVLEFIRQELGTDTYVNIMDQYFPYHEAIGHPVLGRPLRASEYREAVTQARELGLWRLDHRQP